MARYAIPFVAASLVLSCVAMPSLAQNGSLPEDVRAFIARRNDCDHFRGEASPDAERQAEIDREAQRLCTGSDAELAHLMKRYSKNKAVRNALADYDPKIEGGSAD